LFIDFRQKRIFHGKKNSFNKEKICSSIDIFIYLFICINTIRKEEKRKEKEKDYTTNGIRRKKRFVSSYLFKNRVLFPFGRKILYNCGTFPSSVVVRLYLFAEEVDD
jgi:hypothetical protein